MSDLVATLSPDLPVLIAGPTASGKSQLALDIAERQGGLIVNADALQVFENWRVLTARPSQADETLAPHALYGHVAKDVRYSVGQWLRDLTPLLTGHRPIIVGGTGLNFTALTEGLAEIPPVDAAVRATATARLHAEGHAALLAELDAETANRLDPDNPARIQRAWEVLHSSGRSLADWQDSTPAPLLPLGSCQALVIDAPKEWLTPRISQRFDLMLDGGALDEVAANAQDWQPDLPSSKAIGAPELMAYRLGQMTLEAAKERAVIATRQYAKRQRTWFRSKMSHWRNVSWVELG